MGSKDLHFLFMAQELQKQVVWRMQFRKPLPQGWMVVLVQAHEKNCRKTRLWGLWRWRPAGFCSSTLRNLHPLHGPQGFLSWKLGAQCGKWETSKEGGGRGSHIHPWEGTELFSAQGTCQVLWEAGFQKNETGLLHLPASCLTMQPPIPTHNPMPSITRTLPDQADASTMTLSSRCELFSFPSSQLRVFCYSNNRLKVRAPRPADLYKMQLVISSQFPQKVSSVSPFPVLGCSLKSIWGSCRATPLALKRFWWERRAGSLPLYLYCWKSSSEGTPMSYASCFCRGGS